VGRGNVGRRTPPERSPPAPINMGSTTGPGMPSRERSHRQDQLSLSVESATASSTYGKRVSARDVRRLRHF
jgi:hypothetical protein